MNDPPQMELERIASEPLSRFPGEEAGQFIASFLEFAFDLAPFLGIAPAEFGAQFLDMLFKRHHRHLLDGSER
jgi:hypothetical protein